MKPSEKLKDFFKEKPWLLANIEPLTGISPKEFQDVINENISPSEKMIEVMKMHHNLDLR